MTYEPLTSTQITMLTALRQPFAAADIGMLPKPVAKAQPGQQRFACRPGPQAREASSDGKFCGGFHVKSIHLDYVGHAALTSRMLTVDPGWSWDYVAKDEFGNPVYDKAGTGFWIELTIAGITKRGFGDAQGKTGGNAMKEMIGDALRNAGMRFGMALDLWHKGDLADFELEQGRLGLDHVDEPVAEAPAAEEKKPAAKRQTAAQKKAADAQIEKDVADAAAAADVPGVLDSSIATAIHSNTPEEQAANPVQAAPASPVPAKSEAPDDWREWPKGARSLDELQSLYEDAAKAGWYDKATHGAAWTARKDELLAEQQGNMEAGRSQLADGFRQ